MHSWAKTSLVNIDCRSYQELSLKFFEEIRNKLFAKTSSIAESKRTK